MRPLLLALLTASSLSAGVACGAWQRIVIADDPRIAITMLLKADASPADKEFVGFEFDNKTGTPLQVDASNYRVEQVRLTPLAGAGPTIEKYMDSGNSYALFGRDNFIPPGITRRVQYCSTVSAENLGIPTTGFAVDGRVFFYFDRLTTISHEGVPFHFCWLPPDAPGLIAMRERLVSFLSQSRGGTSEICPLQLLLSDPRVATAASVDDLLHAFKKLDWGYRVALRKYINDHFATDERVVKFALESIQAREFLLLVELAQADHLRDARLIEPLVRWAGDMNDRSHAWEFALKMLKNQRGLMPDRNATTAKLGKIAWARSPLLATGRIPADPNKLQAWSWQLQTLALTGDASSVDRIIPHLDDKTIAFDVTRLAVVNDGMSTRVCDFAYNAILDLLDRPGERFAPRIGVFQGANRPERYAHRDALIVQLKGELTAR